MRSDLLRYRASRSGRPAKAGGLTSFLILVILLPMSLVCCSLCYADFSVYGTFKYEDITFDIDGCHGIVERPIREADVLIYNKQDNSIIGNGRTNRNGGIVDINGRSGIRIHTTHAITLQICVTTSTNNTRDLSIVVRNNNDQSIYGLYSEVYNSHPYNQYLNIGTVTAPAVDSSIRAYSIGAAFNLFDCAINGMDYIKFLEGTEERPTISPNGKDQDPFLVINYEVNSSSAYFDKTGIYIRNTYGYSDTILYHEMGHWTHYHFSRSSSPGGSHSITSQSQDPRLSFSEGWATFWGCNLMKFIGPAQYPHPTIYVNLNGAIGEGKQTLSFSYEIEEGRMFNKTSGALDTPVPVSGACSELIVQKVLWDITDNASIQDIQPVNPTSDDDRITSFSFSECWQVFKHFASTEYQTEFITMEDFWDSWFELGNNNLSDMEALFHNNGIFYNPDDFESNITQVIHIGQITPKNTLYPADDEDWFVFYGSVGKEYYVQTQDPTNGVDTYIEIFDENRRLLKSNDNTFDSICSYARIIPPSPNYAGAYYLKVTHSPSRYSYSKYGSYRVLVEEGPARPFIDDGILTVSKSDETAEYSSIKRALKDAKNGNTILLVDNSRFNEILEIMNFRNVIIKAKEGCSPIIDGAGISGSVITLKNAYNVTIEGLTIEGSTDAHGIDINYLPHELVIKNCNIKNNKYCGIYFSGSLNIASTNPDVYCFRILNNSIYNNLIAISMQNGKHLISENNIYKNTDGILFYCNLFYYNTDEEYKLNQTHIFGNYIYNNKNNGICIDSRYANGSSYITNNLIAFNNGAGIVFNPNSNNKNIKAELTNNTMCKNFTEIRTNNLQKTDICAYNCILAGNNVQTRQDIQPEQIQEKFSNSVFFNINGFYGGGNNNTSADPRLVNLGSTYIESNFHLLEGSPCIDSGIAGITQLPATDIEGSQRSSTSPDIGAYESDYTKPIINSIPPQTTREGEAVSFTVTASDHNDNKLNIIINSMAADAQFTRNPWDAVNHIKTGTFTWTPSYNTVIHPNSQKDFIISFTAIRENNNTIASQPQYVKITVQDVNRAPVMDSIQNKTVNENEKLEFVISVSDPDGDTLTYSAVGLPQGASFSNRTFSWTPLFSQSGTYTITLKAQDNGGLVDSKTFTITVANINRVPVMDSIQNKTVNENEKLEFTVNANDPDGDAITYSAVGLPQGAVFTSKVFWWTPSFDQSRTYTITFNAADNYGLSDSKTVTIIVNNKNRAPVLDSIQNKTINENEKLEFTINANDLDGDALTYNATGLPQGAGFSNRIFSWTPSFSQSGTYTVTFKTQDSGGLADNKTITITVNNINRAPVLNSIQNKTVNENEKLEFTVNANDPDGDTLTYSAIGLPQGANFNNKTFSWTPSFSQSGTYTVTFKAQDSGGLADNKTITITVNNINNNMPPEAYSQNINTFENTPVLLNLTASDPDSDSLTFTILSNPINGKLEIGQNVKYIPNVNFTGTDLFTFIASDGLLDSNKATINIKILQADIPESPSENLFSNCTVTASSYYNDDYKPELAVDNKYGSWDKYEWASKGELTPRIKFKLDTPKMINRIMLYGRSNPIDHINDAWLYLSKDGSRVKSIHLGMFPYGGAAKEIIIDEIEIDTTLLVVTDGVGLNNGLSEFMVFYDSNNVKEKEQTCTVTASSYYNDDYKPELAIDNKYGSWDKYEWASKGELTPWIKFKWPNTISTNNIILYERPNSVDHINDAWLLLNNKGERIFSIHLGMFPYGGAPKSIVLDKTEIDEATLVITEGKGQNVGLSEFIVN